MDFDFDSDLSGIANLMRRHIEIRNRSWMKRIHRDCFLGSDAVDFLVQQGFADSRKAAVELCIKMSNKKLLRNITDSKKFRDAVHYYRFFEDDQPTALLGKTNGGTSGSSFGYGGCRWSFAPHTVHNSYIMDIALAEEIERAVGGASIEARTLAISKLRSRVREQVEVDAPNWELYQTISVNNAQISVYTRPRPRGDWKNIKMTGIVNDSPAGFIRSMLNFDRRRQWESAFEDGVIVEAIEIGEPSNALIRDEDLPTPASHQVTKQTIPLPESALKQANPHIARATDDVYTFLQTVDLAGVPPAMAIAFLNDPERQHALAHLRKQMMLSNPQECMLCGAAFENGATDIRFCPCCAMVSCVGCVSKRVFEVVSRQVTSVCVHCYRESSRIFQPPQAVQDDTQIDEALRGKWWRPEELGILDYSTGSGRRPQRESMAGGQSLFNDQDVLEVTALNAAHIKPLIPGLLDDILLQAQQPGGVHVPMTPGKHTSVVVDEAEVSEGEEDVNDVEEEEEDDEEARILTAEAAAEIAMLRGNAATTATAAANPSPLPPTATATRVPSGTHASTTPATTTTTNANRESVNNAKTARCKTCGQMISRDIEAIERHMEECPGQIVSAEPGSGNNATNTKGTYTLAPTASGGYDGTAAVVAPYSSPAALGNLPRQPALATRYPTRIIYRTARTANGSIPPSEATVLQDCFIDEKKGACCVYEVSVRHDEVRGIASEYKTAEVLSLVYYATTIKGTKNAAAITVIAQVADATSREKNSSNSMLGNMLFGSGGLPGGSRNLPLVQDLIKELKQAKDLPDLLRGVGEDADEMVGDGDEEKPSGPSLDDFDLLAVLGRGGFGKVMQVRHKTTNVIFAMKILKKSELRRRRQVERTQTERNILAAVRHPFIVCLHYAFQSSQKLYMVMDFVQGGDFFTLMRKFRRLPEDWVRLFVMEVAMALQHLHDREIVYRDLKPENILLCADGHLKLTDFGLSRYFETRPPGPEDLADSGDYVTRSFCGTEQYMAPEMLLQQGHNHRMDWWCLGLLMHEMISGRHPFHGATHYDTLRNMVTKPPTIDPRLSASAAALVKALLIKNPRARLGGREGLTELQAAAFLSPPVAPTWEALLAKQVEMPYKPRLADAVDISSFEATFTKERPIDSVQDPSAEDGGNVNGGQEKGKKKGVFSSLFGGGKSATPANKGTNGANANSGAVTDDAFKDFSFAKEAPPIVHAPSASAAPPAAPGTESKPAASAPQLVPNRSPLRDRPPQASSLTAAIKGSSNDK